MWGRAVRCRDIAHLRPRPRHGPQFPAAPCGGRAGRPWPDNLPRCAAVVCDGDPARLRAGAKRTDIAVARQRRRAPAVRAPAAVLSLADARPPDLLVVGSTQKHHFGHAEAVVAPARLRALATSAITNIPTPQH